MKIVDFIDNRARRHYTVPPLKSGAGDDGDDED
jgi:UDP-N-acetylglucosamine acyltransferase